MAGHSVIHRED